MRDPITPTRATLAARAVASLDIPTLRDFLAILNTQKLTATVRTLRAAVVRTLIGRTGRII